MTDERRESQSSDVVTAFARKLSWFCIVAFVAALVPVVGRSQAPRQITRTTLQFAGTAGRIAGSIRVTNARTHRTSVRPVGTNDGGVGCAVAMWWAAKDVGIAAGVSGATCWIAEPGAQVDMTGCWIVKSWNR
jgi:hypothetical protein